MIRNVRYAWRIACVKPSSNWVLRLMEKPNYTTPGKKCTILLKNRLLTEAQCLRWWCHFSSSIGQSPSTASQLHQYLLDHWKTLPVQSPSNSPFFAVEVDHLVDYNKDQTVAVSNKQRCWSNLHRHIHLHLLFPRQNLAYAFSGREANPVHDPLGLNTRYAT